MTRSIRKTPIVGMTTAETDKPFKAREHRRERRAVQGGAADGRAGCRTPRAFGNPWGATRTGSSSSPMAEPRDMRK